MLPGLIRRKRRPILLIILFFLNQKPHRRFMLLLMPYISWMHHLQQSVPASMVHYLFVSLYFLDKMKAYCSCQLKTPEEKSFCCQLSIISAGFLHQITCDAMQSFEFEPCC